MTSDWALVAIAEEVVIEEIVVEGIVAEKLTGDPASESRGVVSVIVAVDKAAR